MYSYGAQNALLLERKADMKKRGIPSPDVADAFALTFAYPVSKVDLHDELGWEEDLTWAERNSVTGY